jgi:hypothetical protein
MELMTTQSPGPSRLDQSGFDGIHMYHDRMSPHTLSLPTQFWGGHAHLESQASGHLRLHPRS